MARKVEKRKYKPKNETTQVSAVELNSLANWFRQMATEVDSITDAMHADGIKNIGAFHWEMKEQSAKKLENVVGRLSEAYRTEKLKHDARNSKKRRR